MLFLVKGNRHSCHNSPTQHFSLQGLWSLQSCHFWQDFSKLCVLCISLSPASASCCILLATYTPRLKHSPLCPVPSAHSEPYLPSPLCRGPCHHWKDESGSYQGDLAINQRTGKWPHSPHFKGQYTPWVSVLEKGLCAINVR